MSFISNDTSIEAPQIILFDNHATFMACSSSLCMCPTFRHQIYHFPPKHCCRVLQRAATTKTETVARSVSAFLFGEGEVRVPLPPKSSLGLGLSICKAISVLIEYLRDTYKTFLLLNPPNELKKSLSCNAVKDVSFLPLRVILYTPCIVTVRASCDNL